MILTRQEKEKLVLDLHNQRQPIRVIAKEAGMSFRDIGSIIDKEEKDKEAKEAQLRRGVVSSQAYKLFSAGKTPVQVAVELNLGQLEVTRLCREYWNLVQLDNLNKIYKEIADDIWFFVELYRSAKAAGMDAEHVLNLLRIANNDLPSVESRYENIKERIKSLEEQKRNSDRRLLDLDNQITESSNCVGNKPCTNVYLDFDFDNSFIFKP